MRRPQWHIAARPGAAERLLTEVAKLQASDGEKVTALAVRRAGRGGLKRIASQRATRKGQEGFQYLSEPPTSRATSPTKGLNCAHVRKVLMVMPEQQVGGWPARMRGAAVPCVDS